MKKVKTCVQCNSLFICNRGMEDNCLSRLTCFCSDCNSVTKVNCNITIIRHSSRE